MRNLTTESLAKNRSVYQDSKGLDLENRVRNSHSLEKKERFYPAGGHGGYVHHFNCAYQYI